MLQAGERLAAAFLKCCKHGSKCILQDKNVNFAIPPVPIRPKLCIMDISNNICAHKSHLKFQNTPRILAWTFKAHSCCFSSLRWKPSASGFLVGFAVTVGMEGFPAREPEEVNPMMLFLVLFGIFAGWMWGDPLHKFRGVFEWKKEEDLFPERFIPQKFLDNVYIYIYVLYT